MGSLIATILLFAILFFVSFITKRRFGLLGLALSAGALLSLHWAGTLTPWLESQGIRLVTPPLSALVQILLIMAPATALLLNGPTHTKMLSRVVSSLAFAGLALAYLSDILANILVLDTTSGGLFQFLHDNKSLIIIGGVIASVTDILMTRKPKPAKDGKKGSH